MKTVQIFLSKMSSHAYTCFYCVLFICTVDHGVATVYMYLYVHSYIGSLVIMSSRLFSHSCQRGCDVGGIWGVGGGGWGVG
jgi:hypothetical protein